jgi:putative endonuclease
MSEGRKSRKGTSLGRLGEQLACRYLQEKGYRILETNYANTKGYRIGEIDVVAEQDRELVFVEVKAQLAKGDRDEFPDERITAMKLKRLERIAADYIRARRVDPETPYRFDALLVSYQDASKRARIRHIEHMFL